MLGDDPLVPAMPLLGVQNQVELEFIQDLLFLDSGQPERLGHAPQ